MKTEHQTVILALDRAVSLMIRERDKDLPCILSEANRCNPKNARECGHFIQRERMATRFHPWNVNAECGRCNSSHVSGYRPDKGFPYGLAIDAKYGDGAAKFLYFLANPKHGTAKNPDESWTTDELRQLRTASKIGYNAFLQLYKALRPSHFP